MVQNFRNGLILTGLFSALVLSTNRTAIAESGENQQPIAVLSVASVKSWLDNVAYYGEVAGIADWSNQIRMMFDIFLTGVDRTKPWGVAVHTDGNAFYPLGFVPVSDANTFLEALKQHLGPQQIVDGGVIQISVGPVTLFLKPHGNWIYVGRTAEGLAHLRDDPLSLLGGLNNQYDVAVRTYPNNIPALYRQMALGWINMGIQGEMPQLGDTEGEEVALQHKLVASSRKQFETLLNETETITFGIEVDQDASNTVIDFAMTALPGTPTAERMAAVRQAVSEFSGFLLPKSAVNVHFNFPLAEDDVVQTIAMLKSLKIRVLDELARDTELTDESAREEAKAVLASLFDVAVQTIAQGRMEGGGGIVTADSESLTFAVGGFLERGADLENSVKQLVELAEREQEVYDVHWKADLHRDIVIHTLHVNLTDESWQDVLGSDFEVVLGIGEQSGYLAVGENGTGLLKQVIDHSHNEWEQPQLPSQIKISLLPLLKFFQSMENDNLLLSSVLVSLSEVGDMDQISIETHPLKQGAVSRITLEDGALRVIANLVQSMSLPHFGDVPADFSNDTQ